MSLVILHRAKDVKIPQKLFEILNDDFAVIANKYQENNFPLDDTYVIHGTLLEGVQKSQSRADCITILMEDEWGYNLGSVCVPGWSVQH